MEWNGVGGGAGGEGGESGRRNGGTGGASKAIELLHSLAWLIPSGLPLSPARAWLVLSVGLEREG